ncbi:hypothetical protein [Nocardia sp. NPDC051570]|uniref:hypothetical protein n=1 Tax=Nocardia sp. NPDC051570 TaxID=3364324 RepID=UPI0037B7C95E
MTALTEYTTSKGMIVRGGDLFRDCRESNVRTLRVDCFKIRFGITRAYCTVVRQEFEGQITEPMRPTSMDAERLGGRDFPPATEASE